MVGWISNTAPVFSPVLWAPPWGVVENWPLICSWVFSRGTSFLTFTPVLLTVSPAPLFPLLLRWVDAEPAILPEPRRAFFFFFRCLTSSITVSFPYFPGQTSPDSRDMFQPTFRVRSTSCPESRASVPVQFSTWPTILFAGAPPPPPFVLFFSSPEANSCVTSKLRLRLLESIVPYSHVSTPFFLRIAAFFLCPLRIPDPLRVSLSTILKVR